MAKKNNIEAFKSSNKSQGQVKKHNKDKSPSQEMDDAMLSFIKAISEGDIGEVRDFLSEISQTSVERSEIDEKFLYAVQDGLIQEVRELISAGANLNTFDDLGNTALHIAVELNFVNIVDILLTAGADPSIENDLGQTPFQLAQETFLRYQQILKLFSANS